MATHDHGSLASLEPPRHYSPINLYLFHVFMEFCLAGEEEGVEGGGRGWKGGRSVMI